MFIRRRSVAGLGVDLFLQVSGTLVVFVQGAIQFLLDGGSVVTYRIGVAQGFGVVSALVCIRSSRLGFSRIGFAASGCAEYDDEKQAD